MTMRRQWVATCDHEGCEAMLTGIASLKHYEFGEQVNDEGWNARPSDPKTFCPDHWPAPESHDSETGADRG